MPKQKEKTKFVSKGNPNYKRGANLERKVKKYFENQGWLATRSAGSHGIFDVWAISGDHIRLVQCKIGMSVENAAKLVFQIKKELLQTYPEIHHDDYEAKILLEVIVGFESNGTPKGASIWF